MTTVNSENHTIKSTHVMDFWTCGGLMQHDKIAVGAFCNTILLHLATIYLYVFIIYLYKCSYFKVFTALLICVCVFARWCVRRTT